MKRRLISRERRARWVQAMLRGLARLPLGVVHALGSVIGGGLWLLPNDTRRIAARNLAACWPELSAAERRRLLRRNLMETAKGMLELGALWQWPLPRVLALVREVHGEADYRAAVAAGHGVVLLTPHLGAWEVSGLYAASLSPITSLYRPTRLGIDELVSRGRERGGARLVPTDQRGVRALLAALRHGEVAGILPDQDPGADNGEFAPFFGIPACTMTLVSRLAARSGTPVFLVYAERLAHAAGFRLVFSRLDAAIGSADQAASLAALNAGVEAAIRRVPAQYLWSYKRFKTRPAGEPPFY